MPANVARIDRGTHFKETTVGVDEAGGATTTRALVESFSSRASGGFAEQDREWDANWRGHHRVIRAGAPRD